MWLTMQDKAENLLPHDGALLYNCFAFEFVPLLFGGPTHQANNQKITVETASPAVFALRDMA